MGTKEEMQDIQTIEFEYTTLVDPDSNIPDKIVKSSYKSSEFMQLICEAMIKTFAGVRFEEDAVLATLPKHFSRDADDARKTLMHMLVDETRKQNYPENGGIKNGNPDRDYFHWLGEAMNHSLESTAERLGLQEEYRLGAGEQKGFSIM